MLFRMLSNKEQLPPLNSIQMDSYCDVIVDILNDQNRCLALFRQAIDIASDSDMDISDKYQLKQKDKTESLISACKDFLSIS